MVLRPVQSHGALLRRTLSLRTLSSASTLLKFKTVLEKGPPHLILHRTPTIPQSALLLAMLFTEDWPRLRPRMMPYHWGGALPTSSYSSPIVPIYQNVATRPPPTEVPRAAAITFFLNVDWGRKKKTLQCWESGPPNATNSLSTFIKERGSVPDSGELMKIPSSGKQHVALFSYIFPLIVIKYWLIILRSYP